MNSTPFAVLWRFLFAVLSIWSMGSLAFAFVLSPGRQPLLWTKQEVAGLPPSVSLYAGHGRAADGSPVRAWYVDIDYNDKALELRPVLSTSPRGRQPVTEMARAVNALVAVNGGYFDMVSVPARTFSLVRSRGVTLRHNIGRITRRNGFYYAGRSAFGVRADRSFDIQWIVPRGDASAVLPGPLPNTSTAPALPPTEEQLYALPVWDVTEAIGGGPRLLQAGEERITFEQEVFFGSGFLADVPYARTALGYTPQRRLILFVADGGRPFHSVGMTLSEVAQELKKLGCVEAMNLDGGGSTTLVINGQLINTPSGNGLERNVTSILALVAAPENPDGAMAPPD